MHLSVLSEHYTGSVKQILKQYTNNVSVYCHQQDTRRLLRGVWLIGNAFWLWPVLLSVTAGNKLFGDTCQMYVWRLCIYFFVWKLYSNAWKFVGPSSENSTDFVTYELPVCPMCRLWEVRSLTTKARRAEGDNYTTLLLKATCHDSWILVLSRFAYSICPAQRYAE